MSESEPTSSPATLPADTLAFAARIFDAARSGDSDLLIPAVDAGLPVNLTNDAGNSLLMLAAYAGHASLTSSLLERGADVTRVNDRGQSILAGAVFRAAGAAKSPTTTHAPSTTETSNPYLEIIRALLAAGADPRVGTPSAMDTARMFGGDHKFDSNEPIGNTLMQLLGARVEDAEKPLPGAMRM